MIAQPTSLLKEAAREIKPQLRGWLHLGTFPLSVAAGIVLVSLSPDAKTRIASGVFALSSSMLFGSSALFHRGHWGPRWHRVLRRIDHSNIFLLIAGTYTPFALMLLDDTNARILLSLVWGGALLGIAFRIFWIGAPRWLYLPVYVALGWAAIFWMGDFAASAGPAVLTLIVVGGGLYSVGGVVYGLQRPNPIPHLFGFHEVFHTLTIAAFVVHYIGVSMIVYSRR
ncbi:MAG: hemolysin III family protein [Nocardioidaceae bacterium]|nr:hemolysin III family protein [Nocardioidaceae bacterium]